QAVSKCSRWGSRFWRLQIGHPAVSASGGTLLTVGGARRTVTSAEQVLSLAWRTRTAFRPPGVGRESRAYAGALRQLQSRKGAENVQAERCRRAGGCIPVGRAAVFAAVPSRDVRQHDGDRGP